MNTRDDEPPLPWQSSFAEIFIFVARVVRAMYRLKRTHDNELCGVCGYINFQ